MATVADLRALLVELQRTSSPVARLRLLGRGWKALRQLGPGQARALARRIGFDGAEEVIERLGRNRGRLDGAMMLRLLHGLEQTDAAGAQELIGVLRDPTRRGELLQTVMDEVDAVGGDVVADEPPTDDRVPGPGGGPEPTAAPADELQTGVSIPPPEPAVPEPEPEPPPEPEQAPEPEPAFSPPVPAPEPRPAVAAGPLFAAAAVARPPAVDRPVQERENRGTSALTRRLDDSPALMRRFRLLREGLAEARELDPEQLRELVERFPPGWARRRALDALLRAGIPSELHPALFLVESLESPTGRRWCLRTILHSRDLTSEERTALRARVRPSSRARAGGGDG